ncbi:MAG: FAD-dependent thymidylate synthase [Fretibacterium sp.]|nr:FAD-dependent thymidylate synthase [Fretibacterium sp.]
MSCRVNLLTHTPRADEVVTAAARLCYSDSTADNLLTEELASLSVPLLELLQRSGHHSPFEHASFTFAVDGLSRVTSHQLVRHRIASFSQQSQRYVRMETPDVILPPSLLTCSEAQELFLKQAREAHETYKKLISLGIPQEDARFILPHGWETRLVLTMNARELHHFYHLRLCRRAQWEIRELARLMLIETRKAAPLLFALAGPSCLFRECEEARPCGRPFNDMEELLAKD